MDIINQIGQIGSMLGALLMVALILYGSYYCSKKVAKLSFQGNQSKYMKVVDKIMLGQDRYVTILKVGDLYYLMGSSKEGITLLSELDEEKLTELETPVHVFSPEMNFKDILKRVGKDKDRRP